MKFNEFKKQHEELRAMNPGVKAPRVNPHSGFVEPEKPKNTTQEEWDRAMEIQGKLQGGIGNKTSNKVPSIIFSTLVIVGILSTIAYFAITKLF